MLGFPPGLRLYAYHPKHCEFICASSLLCLGNCFRELSWNHWLSQPFCPLCIHRSLSLVRQGVIETSNLGLNTPSSPALFRLTSCRSLFQLLSTARSSFSNEAWEMHWSMGVAISHWEATGCILWRALNVTKKQLATVAPMGRSYQAGITVAYKVPNWTADVLHCPAPARFVHVLWLRWVQQ